MVVEILEQLAIFDESLLKPGAVIRADLIKRLGSAVAIALDFAHDEKSTLGPSGDRSCGQVS